MRHRFYNSLVLASLAHLALMLCASCSPALCQGYLDNVIIARLNSGVNPNAVASAYGVKVGVNVISTTMYTFNVPNSVDASAVASRMNGDARVAYAEIEATVGAPEVTGDQFHFPFDITASTAGLLTQSAFTQVNAQVGGSSYTFSIGGSTFTLGGFGNLTQVFQRPVVVAILDTGVSAYAPALWANLVWGYNEVDPGSFPLDVADGVTNGAVGHGTMVAGLIVTLAPSCRIMPIRVLNGDGAGTLVNVISGISYAVANGANVINLSLGTTIRSQALQDAIASAQSAGCLIVTSAGNNATNSPQWPAAFPGVIATGSVEANDTLSVYSNYGADVTVVAPGTVMSTYINGEYANWAGTSFSAALVSGEAALVWAANPNDAATDVYNTITQSTDPVDQYNPLHAGQLGSGIIDFSVALPVGQNVSTHGAGGYGGQ